MAVKRSNVIELNGNAYDALTGAMLGPVKRAEAAGGPIRHIQAMPLAVKQPHPRAATNSVDGMVRRLKQPGQPKHLTAHQPQPTKTLMRRAVKAPQALTAQAAPHRKTLQAQSPLNPGLPAKLAVKTKLSSDAVDPHRLRRAAAATQSHLVKHFTPSKHLKPAVQPFQQAQPVQASKPVAVAPVALNPVAHRVHQHTAPAASRAMQDFRRQRSNLTARSAAPQTAIHSTQAAHPVHHGQSQQHLQPATSALIDPNDNYDDRDIFEQALAHATSHQEKSPKQSAVQHAKRGGRRHRKLLGIMASVSVFLLLVGFVAYQNKDNIQLQMASAKAGFSASVPANPPGYSLNDMAYASGTVAMNFQNKDTNGTGFKIIQKKSNWDSQTLLDNVVVASNEPYQGYESAGRTVYVYGKGKATWVNGGIWYQIQNADALTNDQIVKVAASM